MLYEFSERKTLIHNLDPRLKLLMALLFTVSSFFLRTPIPLLTLLLIIVVYGAIGGLFPWHYRKVIYLLIPFGIMMTLIQIIVFYSIEPTPALNFLGIPIPVAGLMWGGMISIRMIVLAVSFALFMMASHPSEITQGAALAGLPFRYAYMIGFALRFLPLFAEDFTKIRQAQASRGLDENRFGYFTRYISLPILLFPLIMTVLRHAQNMAIALEMRGLSTGSTYGRTWLKDMYFKPTDWLFLILGISLLVVTIVARILGYL
jgi:energy-coupling factor transport system permease protein